MPAVDKKPIDEAIHVDSDKYDEILGSDEKEDTSDILKVKEPKEEKPQPKQKTADILTELEEEKEQSDNSKEIERRAQVNDFIIEWSKDPEVHYSVIGGRLKMLPQKSNDFASEFMSIMRHAVEHENYPKGVTDYFNHPSIPSNRRITHQMMDRLAPTVDMLITSIEKPNNSNPSSDNMSYDNSQTQQQQTQQQQPTVSMPIMPNPPGATGFNKIPGIMDPDDIGDEQLVQNNHTITQLINFGLKKFSIEPAQQRRQIMDLIRTSKLFYATNRNALRDLLSSVIKHQPTVNSFLDWLEAIAPTYLLPGEPFYRMMNGGMGPNDPNAPGGGIPPIMQQLIGNLPPAQAQMVMQNLFSNNKNSEQQRQAEEDAQLDRQVSRLYKVMTISMLKNAMDPNAQAKQGMGSDLSQQYIMQGYRPSEVIQPDGTRRIEWLPPYAQNGGGQNGPFQSVESVIGLVKAILDVSGAAKPGSDLSETMTKVMMEKFMTDPIDQLAKLKQVGEQLGLTAPAGGTGIDPVKQLELQMNLAKLNNEKDFGMRQLEIQERQMQREEAREAAHEQQSNENIAMLMKFVPGVINNMAMPVIQKFFGGGGGNKAEAVAPQTGLMDPQEGGQQQEGFSGTMYAPQQQPRGGIFNRTNKLLKQGAVPIGGIMNENDYYVDPQNDPSAMSSIQEQGEAQRRAEERQQIENEVMHRINMTHIRNNSAPPFPQHEIDHFTKEQLSTLSNEELAAIGQTINNQREKYESSIKDFNEVVRMRQAQAQSQQQSAVMTEDQYDDAYVPTQQQQHPPVVENKKRFSMPEDTDMNSDGVISEEDYEEAVSSSSVEAEQGSAQDQVVDFSSAAADSQPSVPSFQKLQNDDLLSDEDLAG